MAAVQNLVKSVEYLGSRYSVDMKNLVVYLLSKPTSVSPTIEELMSMLSGRMVHELDNLYKYVKLYWILWRSSPLHLTNYFSYSDLLESDLSKEVENGRLCRTLMKLGFVNERPEYDMDPSWSETGDRYLLKLFRDYVFHQVYEDNTPLIDYGHVVECLNKVLLINYKLIPL
jgi:PAB-dependent poly(A)-specific ribonuclease subunit 3